MRFLDISSKALNKYLSSMNEAMNDGVYKSNLICLIIINIVKLIHWNSIVRKEKHPLCVEPV